MNRIKVGVLISGRGSNLAALAAAARAEDYPATIVLVLSNNPDAGGLAFARGEGIAARAIDAKPYGKDRQAHERALDAALRDAGAEVVALAGYMRIFTPWFIAAWAGRMINIHPSLLPAFPGLHTHARALAAGVKLHGCTVHYVTEVMDEGPIIAQAAVPVLPGDTEDALGARVLAQEHVLYPLALRLAAGAVPLAPHAEAALLNPLPPPAPSP